MLSVRYNYWALFKHDPLFMVRNVKDMLAFNFRGRTFKTFLGLEDEQQALMRYRGLRAIERTYV
jgi:hypothetical protein